MKFRCPQRRRVLYQGFLWAASCADGPPIDAAATDAADAAMNSRRLIGDTESAPQKGFAVLPERKSQNSGARQSYSDGLTNVKDVVCPGKLSLQTKLEGEMWRQPGVWPLLLKLRSPIAQL